MGHATVITLSSVYAGVQIFEIKINGQTEVSELNTAQYIRQLEKNLEGGITIHVCKQV